MRTLPRRLLCLPVGFAVLVLVLFGIPGCKSSSSPDDDRVYFTVTNISGITTYIYWNGVLQFALDHATEGVVLDANLGTHTLTAKIEDTDVVIVSTSINIEYPGRYQFIIDGPSSIRVTNHYGEILSITMNNVYQGDIADGLTFTLRKVPFGSFFFEARIKNEEDIVAAATITVDEIATYSWVIAR